MRKGQDFIERIVAPDNLYTAWEFYARCGINSAQQYG